MSKVMPMVSVLLLMLGMADAQHEPTLLGIWHGQIEVPEQPLEIGLAFFQRAGVLEGVIDIPAQGVADSPLKDVVQRGRTVSFALTAVPGKPTFEGKLEGELDNATLSGTFSQSGQRFPFRVTPGKAEALERPQEPKPPFPYRVEEVSYKNGPVTLAGTLTLPKGKGPFAAVLLITGSGAQDRDETIAGHKPFLLLADTLTRAGYAVLRTDDRGVGGSSGQLAQADYPTLTGDILAGLAFLKRRPDIDPERIGLFGHSEGGYLAPLAAEHAKDVAFVIMMAGPAVSGSAVLIRQNQLILEGQGAPAAQVEAQVSYLKTLTALLQQGNLGAARQLARRRLTEQYSTLPPAQRPSREVQAEQIEQLLSPNFRAFVAYNPTGALEHLRVPVLAFYGGKDLQVPAAQSVPVLRRLLRHDPDVTIRVFPNLNHLMQPTKTGKPSDYATIPTTLDPQVLRLVTGWLKARF